MSMFIFTGYLVLILGFLGLVLGGWIGAAIGLASSALVFGAAWAAAPGLIHRSYHTVPLHDKKIERLLKKISHNAEIHHPRLEVLHTPLPNVMVYGTTETNMTIVLTDGLLALGKKHVRAALAFGVASIKLEHVRSATLSAVISMFLGKLPQWGYDLVYFWKTPRRAGYAAMALAPLSGFPVRLTQNDFRFYKDDWNAGLLIKDTTAIADVIRVASREARLTPAFGPAATSGLWIVPPFRIDTFHSWYHIHPQADKRVEMLEIIRSFHHSEEHLLGGHGEHDAHESAEHAPQTHAPGHAHAHS